MRTGLVFSLAAFTGLWSLVCLAEPGKNACEPVAPPPALDRQARPPAAAAPPILDLEDAAEPFVPAHPRSEAEANRVEALGLFAAARIDEQEDRLHQALRRYQRAAFFDPTSQVARRQAVTLAMRLGDGEAGRQQKPGHWKEALRYAAKGELGIDDAGVLWELAGHFAKQEQYAEALKHYRAARALQPEKRSTGYVVLSLDVARIAYLNREFAAAADAFSEVMEALEHPDQYGLDERIQRRLLAGKDGTTSLAQLYLLFAEAFVAAERFDQAEAALEKANRLAPNAAVHAFRHARIEDLRHQPAKALATLEQYYDAKERGEGLAPYHLLAKLLSDLGRSGETLSTLETMHGRDPDNQPLAIFLADEYRKVDQLGKAESLYASLLSDAPPAVAYLAYRGLATTRHRLKQTGGLLDLLGEVVGKTGGLAVLGDEAKAIADDAETVEALVRLAREKHQADADSLGFGPRLALALIALEAKRLDDAAEFFERAMKVNHESAKDIYRVWGIGLMTTQHYADAAKVLRRAIDERAITTGDPTFHFLLAGALALEGKGDEALAAAQHAASLAPRSPQVAGRVAWVLYFAKRYDEAAEKCRDLVRRFDEEDQSDEGRTEVHKARMMLSNMAVIQNDMPSAEEWLLEVLDEFPDDVGAQNDLGYLWADQGKRLRTALAMIERAVAAEPENAAFRDSLGWALHRLGRHDEAVAELKKAAAGDEPDGVMLEHLGDACQAASQLPAADDAWRKALAAFEKEGDAEKIARIKKKLAIPPPTSAAAR